MNLHRFGRIVLGFLNLRKETPRILLITGLLTKCEKEFDLQITAYEQWLNESIKITGILKVPDDQIWDLKQTKQSKIESVLS